MPAWTQYILGTAGLLIALGVLWTKAIRPLGLFLYKSIKAQQEMLPLLQNLTEVFKDNPSAFKVLDEIVAQFRTDSGSSLRDAVNRIEEASKAAKIVAEEAKIAADELKIGVAATKQLTEMDRAERRDQMLKLDRVSEMVRAGAATGLRLEQGAGIVADELAAAHQRADEAHGEAGAAADAAVQKEK